MANASLVISTRNRLAYVRRAVSTALSQTVPLDILVLDDGSTDGTTEALRHEFPGIRVESSPLPIHQMAQRNRGVRMVDTEFVVMIDDDAFFPWPSTIEHALAEFDDDRIAVVTIPFVNARHEDFLWQRAPSDADAWAAGTFVGCACVLRRSAFLEVGGYNEKLVSQGEEGDLALRLIAAGYVLRLGTADPVVHWEAAPVKPAANFRFSARNEIYLTWCTTPNRYLASRTATVVARALHTGVVQRQIVPVLAGIVAGPLFFRANRGDRRPVPEWAYRLSRELRREGPMRVPEVYRIIDRAQRP